MAALLAVAALLVLPSMAFAGIFYRGFYLGLAIIAGLGGWIAVESTPSAAQHARLVASGADASQIAGSELFLRYGVDMGLVAFGLAIGAVIAAAVYRAPKAAPVPARTCPFCAEQIQPAAVVCRFCGRELPTAPATTGPVRVDGNCATCGTPLAADAYYCRTCKAGKASA